MVAIGRKRDSHVRGQPRSVGFQGNKESSR
jgi:hypothetical protein